VLTEVAPRAGESLIGLLTNVAAENWLSSVVPLLGLARPHEHAHRTLAVRDDLDFAQLAFAARLDPCAVETRRYRPTDVSGGIPCVDFHGAAIPFHDLMLGTRRGAPSWLTGSPRHSALGHHGIVTHCPKSGELLTDRCPHCATVLRWSRTDLARCHGCDLLIGDIPAQTVTRRQFMSTQLLIDVIHPDPARHAKAVAEVPAELAGLNRGAIFELGWRMGAILTGHGLARRTADKTLPVNARLEILAAGSAAIRAWPEVVNAELSASLKRDGGHAAAKLAKSIMEIGSVARGWPALRATVDAAMPTAKSYAAKVKSLVENGSNSRELERALGVSQDIVTRLRHARKIPLVMASVNVQSREIFEGGRFAEMREMFDDRIPMGAVSERLDVSRNGVEQMCCLELVQSLDQDVMRIAFSHRHVRRSTFFGLMDELARLGQREDLDEVVPIHRALLSVGGRSKPWGPIIRSMLEGDLRYRVDNRHEGPFMNRVSIDRAQIGFLCNLTFDEAEHPPRSNFDTMINGRDAEEMLNLKPRAFYQALKAGELPTPVDGLYDRSAIIELAQHYISGGEVIARWVSTGRAMPAPLKGQDRIRREGKLGWERTAVEDAMHDVGLVPF
jgi:hypothetical protein